MLINSSYLQLDLLPSGLASITSLDTDPTLVNKFIFNVTRIDLVPSPLNTRLLIHDRRSGCGYDVMLTNSITQRWARYSNKLLMSLFLNDCVITKCSSIHFHSVNLLDRAQNFSLLPFITSTIQTVFSTQFATRLAGRSALVQTKKINITAPGQVYETIFFLCFQNGFLILRHKVPCCVTFE